MRIVHTVVAQQFQRGGVLYMFGNGLLAQRMGHLVHGIYHGLVYLAVGHALHKGAINFQFVDRQTLEIGERREARAEVIQGELTAHALECNDEFFCFRELGDGRCFRYFKAHP